MKLYRERKAKQFVTTSLNLLKMAALVTVSWALIGSYASAQSLAASTIHTFSAVNNMVSGANFGGAHVWSALVDSGAGDGLLYGMTADGGTHGNGMVFTISYNGDFVDIHDFAALNSDGVTNAEGAHPYDSLILDGSGGFYGSARFGGVNGTGTLFHITPQGVFTTLYSFDTLASDLAINTSGAYPNGLVLGTDGSIYGTTECGDGKASGGFFQYKPNANLFRVLHNFGQLNPLTYSNADGARPFTSLVMGPDGKFYGGTSVGGNFSHGVVFSVTTAGQLHVMHIFSKYFLGSFANNDGANCSGVIVGKDGVLYGTCYSGGVGGSGSIFSITTAGKFTTLHGFGSVGADSALGSGFNSDGAYPNRLVQGENGALYGTASGGGTTGYGSIFMISTDGQTSSFQSLTSLYGGSVETGLTLGMDGNLYGTTELGGGHQTGTVFQAAP